MRDANSFLRGIRAMDRKRDLFHGWGVWSWRDRFAIWIHYWTPIWHDGRGY